MGEGRKAKGRKDFLVLVTKKTPQTNRYICEHKLH